VARNPSVEDLKWALDLAERWRACHAYPINTFQANLRGKLRSFGGEPIAAQRLKRMPTIIDKLKRYPEMELARMQDIGGIRAILASVEDVYALASRFRDSLHLKHELIREYDYIKKPRDEDGYRSLHLVYKYRSKRAPDYNGLFLELQIRTRLQHVWATAVETMGTFLGQALKSRQGDKEWLDFFALVSSAFSHLENCAPIPRFAHMGIEQTIDAVAEAESGIGALTKMTGLAAAANEIVGNKRSLGASSYHLIVLDSLNKKVNITAYGRDDFDQAALDYVAAEARALKGEKIEPVLVSAGPIDQLHKAYPNFFLNISDFVTSVTQMVENSRTRKAVT